MKYKFVYLIFSTLFFSVVYSLIRPRNFHGLNKIQDKIQDVLVEVETDVIEPFASYEDTKQVKQDIKKMS